jgi:hypothetical protein
MQKSLHHFLVANSLPNFSSCDKISKYTVDNHNNNDRSKLVDQKVTYCNFNISNKYNLLQTFILLLPYQPTSNNGLL